MPTLTSREAVAEELRMEIKRLNEMRGRLVGSRNRLIQSELQFLVINAESKITEAIAGLYDAHYAIVGEGE